MKKNLVLVLSLALTTFGCVSGNVNTPTTPSSSSSVSANPTPSTNVTPVPSSTPTETPTPTPSISATPVPTPTATPSFLKKNELVIGIGNTYSSITNQTSTDIIKDRTNNLANIEELNPSFVILRLNQEIPDNNLDGEIETWTRYDDILNELKDKNIEAFLKINFDVLLTDITTPSRSEYLDFLGRAAEHFKEQNYKISWVIGSTINDLNTAKGTQQDYVDFLRLSYEKIKSKDETQQVYMGSFSQAELQGKYHYFTAENLLSFINMSANQYTDGFIFEVYSFAVEKDTDNSGSVFKGLDYKIIQSYYTAINDILQLKNISDKKLLLVTGAYGSDIVDGVAQTRLDQANDIFRKIVYGVASGFDKVYIPEFSDKKGNLTSSFFDKLGLLEESSLENKKLSYWTYKFLSDKLKGYTYMGNIENIPQNSKGFIFEKDGKTSYVLWNDDEDFKDFISFNIKGKSGVIYTSPTEVDKLGTSLSFNLDNENGQINVAFFNNPLNPRIVEINN